MANPIPTLDQLERMAKRAVYQYSQEQWPYFWTSIGRSVWEAAYDTGVQDERRRWETKMKETNSQL